MATVKQQNPETMSLSYSQSFSYSASHLTKRGMRWINAIRTSAQFSQRMSWGRMRWEQLQWKLRQEYRLVLLQLPLPSDVWTLLLLLKGFYSFEVFILSSSARKNRIRTQMNPNEAAVSISPGQSNAAEMQSGGVRDLCMLMYVYTQKMPGSTKITVCKYWIFMSNGFPLRNTETNLANVSSSSVIYWAVVSVGSVPLGCIGPSVKLMHPHFSHPCTLEVECSAYH